MNDRCTEEDGNRPDSSDHGEQSERRDLLTEVLGFTDAEATAFLAGDQDVLYAVAARKIDHSARLTLVESDDQP